ncbi:UvrD-helicase domain-containing protein [Paraburkholderia domus]|uniref:UvrD-helicase domain-containing protein n=1 Tax=Paraburkholderia domus TaxID=2793075 RepID=UPI0019141E9A|nr:UvrD-helicase domain-containing protein [Paraburkholderia domus]MBK5066000.1 ATP-dependent helicase [Burkholderia sp. R-70199]CAE6964974.1 ATP-dependent DNA helicase Rep [Paraburkholderia domus]
MPHSFKPTVEQRAVVDAVLGGGDLKVKAYAGAGKTSTLRLIADHLAGKRGSYLAFNKEIAEHARRGFPSNVSARTVHSLAYGSVAPALTARLNVPGEAPHELAARFGLGPIQVPTITGKTVEVAPFEIGRMVADGLGRFCRSAQLRPEASHIPVDEKVHEKAADWLRESLLPYVVRLWNESIDPRGRSAIAPDVYLKVWAQTDPRIDADFILFDEAQDSDGVMLAVLGLQRHAQIIYVGDPYQQIYEWRGAVNAMAQIDAPERALTESFRFGPMVAALASRILGLLDERTPIRGQDSIGSILVDDHNVSPPVDAILCRKNVTAIWQLAAGVEAGYKPAIRMNPAEIVAFADGADQLLAGRRAFRPTAFSLFETWKDAQSFARSAVGRDLLPIVRIVDECGTGYLRELARRVTPAADADYVISTVHRAKGLQWKRVKVANDFRFKSVDGRLMLDEDELRLLYVAVTRAQHVLDISELREDLIRLFNSRR